MKSKKVYEKYLRILPLFLSEKKYQERLEQIRADRKGAMELWEDSQSIIQEGMEDGENETRSQEQWRQLTDHMKTEYLRNTAGGM